jgi:hypothetical protein
MLKLPTETATLLHAVFDLLGRLKASDEALAAELEQGAARVTVDCGERMILVAVVDRDGHGHPLVAVQADAFDREEFGAVGVPVAVPGMYADGPAH